MQTMSRSAVDEPDEVDEPLAVDEPLPEPDGDGVALEVDVLLEVDDEEDDPLGERRRRARG
jgi:hypothetical protein